MSDNTSRTKNKATEQYIGLMADNMRACGKTANNMDEADTETLMAYGKKGNGQTEKE